MYDMINIKEKSPAHHRTFSFLLLQFFFSACMITTLSDDNHSRGLLAASGLYAPVVVTVCKLRYVVADLMVTVCKCLFKKNYYFASGSGQSPVSCQTS